jgi:phage tail sheath protein FI
VAGAYASGTNDVRGLDDAPLERSFSDSEVTALVEGGVNPLRGRRIWSARTLDPDPEWNYVKVRRLLVFLERSIDQGLQWVAFEPNGEPLWAAVRATVSDFLATRDEPFFVRCDRTTMTQEDLDSGRLVCVIGVAPLRPAEFVIIRIGQWTADAHS